MTVQLIASTIPDWPRYVLRCQEAFGTSPTRELDQSGIAVGSLDTYATSLEFITGQNKNNRSLDFIHLTFIIYNLDFETISNYANLSEMCKLVYQNRSKGIILSCGSLRQYRDLIQVGCDYKLPVEIRAICNSIHTILEQLGFRSLFRNKKTLADGTYTFEER